MLDSMPRRLLSATAAIVFIFFCSGVSAQTPTVFSYQGRLLTNDATQAPVDGTIDVDFSIWSGPTGDGSAMQLWSESWTGVNLSNGVFSVLLGSNGSPLDPADFQGDTTLFLQLVIDGETLTPRQQLGAVPFAVVDEPGNERQDITLSGDTLQLTDSTASVDLAPYMDNTDDQVLTRNGNTLELTSDDGTDIVDLDSLANTDNQVLTISGTDLRLTSDDGDDIVSLADIGLDDQVLTLTGTDLRLTSDNGDDVVDLSSINTDNQALSLSGTNLMLSSQDGTDSINLAPFLDNTDSQTLSLAGNNLSISGSGSTVNLSAFANTDAQTLTLSGNILTISGSGASVSLAGYLDNTDNQDLGNVLANGTDAGNRNITNVNAFDANDITGQTLDCPDCVQTADIDDDTIGGNDIQDNIFILHIECNGSCADMSLREACDVIENLRGLSLQTELIGVSCAHGVPSTTGNGFVACDDGTEVHGDNECRAFNLRTLGDIPCIDGDGTDALVTCLLTDIPK